jgi:hypothetical protein
LSAITYSLRGASLIRRRRNFRKFAAFGAPSQTVKRSLPRFVTVLSQTGALPVTVERLFSFLLMNQAKVQNFKAQFDKALSTNAGQVFANQSWTMNLQNFGSAWTGLMEALGTPAAQIAVPVMRGIADDMNALTGWIGENPGAAKALADFTLVFGSFLTTTGSVMVAEGALSMLVKTLPPLAAVLEEFAAGGAAGAAMMFLTSPAGLIGLAAGVTALGASVKGVPTWLIHAVQGAAVGAAVGGKVGAVGAVGGAIAGGTGGVLWGLDPLGLNDVYWSPLHPFTITRAPPPPPAAAPITRRLPAAPAAAPAAAPITLNSHTTINVAVPPGSDGHTIAEHIKNARERHDRELPRKLQEIQDQHRRRTFLDAGQLGASPQQ